MIVPTILFDTVDWPSLTSAGSWPSSTLTLELLTRMEKRLLENSWSLKGKMCGIWDGLRYIDKYCTMYYLRWNIIVKVKNSNSLIHPNFYLWYKLTCESSRLFLNILFCSYVQLKFSIYAFYEIKAEQSNKFHNTCNSMGVDKESVKMYI